MQRPSRKTELAVWGLLSLTVLVIVAAFVRERLNPKSARLPALFPVPPFALTNQAGRLFSSEELKGKVWLSDVFFTSCAGPCPRLSTLMAQVQAAFESNSPVRLVSITTDPDRDTPDVLARYARRFAADPDRWQFLTGTSAQLRAAAVDALKFTALPKEPAQRESATDLFIHSTLLVLVDRRGWVRASFELDEPEARERIVAAVRELMKESP